MTDAPGDEPEPDADTVSVNTSTINSQAVNATIHRVQELALQVAEENGKVYESHLEDFHCIAEGLTDLEESRKQLRDQLEVETIQSSKQRYALQILPEKYKKEMEDAVMAARLANQDDMKSMQQRLDVAREEAEFLTKRHMQLAQENSKLHPECNQVRKEHDEIIAQLNQRMSDKANKQIVLNETRDALRDVQQQTKEIDVGHENLAEDMEIERKEAAKLKADLLTEVNETETAITAQKGKNTEEKRVSDKIQEKIMEMGVKLDEKQKNLRRLENSYARLEMQSLQLTDKIERERIANQDIFHEKETLQAAKNKRQAEYDAKVEELQKKIKAVSQQIEDAETDKSVISGDMSRVADQRDMARRRKSKAVAKAKEAAIKVENLKKETSRMVEAAAEYNQSNTAYKEKLVVLEENHLATVNTYNSQIDEYKENLGQERQERMKVQELRDESEKVLENFRSDQLQFMNDMTRSIESARQEHTELTNKSLWYNRETAKNKRNAETLSVRLEVSQGSFKMMKESLHMEVERLKNSIELLTADNARKEKYLEDKKPEIADLSVELEERSKEYNVLKNEVVAVRNREKSVNDQITRVKLQMDKLVKPMEKLKAMLEEKRKLGMDQLQSQSDERKQMETDIYTIAMTLENVVKENEKFHQEGDMIEEDSNVLREDMKTNSLRQKALCRELAHLQHLFAEAWNVCISMERASADQDEEILQGIVHLQEETRDRAIVLNGIAESLKSELDSLTEFVENVSSRRPKETRQGKRKSVGPSHATNLQQPSARDRSLRSPSPPKIRVTPVPPAPPTVEKPSPIVGQRRKSSTKGAIRSTSSRPVVTPVGTT